MKRPFVALLMALCLVAPLVAGAWGEGLVEEAFRAIVEAEAAGGEVEALIGELNRAIRLLEEGGEAVVEAEQILNQIIVDAGAVRDAGVQQGNIDAAVAILKVALLLGAATLVWLRGDEWFWRLWLRVKKNYIVE
jgi:hypothetical protein